VPKALSCRGVRTHDVELTLALNNLLTGAMSGWPSTLVAMPSVMLDSSAQHSRSVMAMTGCASDLIVMEPGLGWPVAARHSPGDNCMHR
jgi:hypothetical protein